MQKLLAQAAAGVLSLAVKGLQISVDFVGQLQASWIYSADMLDPVELESAP